MSTVILKAECLCRAHTFTHSVPLSTLPLRGSSCHCTSCRHVTGALRGSADAVWPGPTADIVRVAGEPPRHDGDDADNNDGEKNNEGNAKLARYRHSPRVNVLFCARCGTELFFEEWENAEAKKSGAEAAYAVFTGALNAAAAEGPEGADVPPITSVQVVQYADHIFVGDTRDGGALPWLRGINGEGQPAPKVWLGGRNRSEEVAEGVRWPAVEALAKFEDGLKGAEGDAGNVPIRCHCGGIDLVLRAGEAQREFEALQKSGKELPWFADPVTYKGVGSVDGCDSCRLAVGSELHNWTFALVKHISFAGADQGGFPEDTLGLRAAVDAADGTTRDPRFGTITYYSSSPEVQRYFCGRCSAVLFYAADDRSELVDVAVGLLDAPDGARAETAVSWAFGSPIVYRQDMIGTWREALVTAVERDAEAWRIERGYPKFWRRAAKEAAEKAEQEKADKEKAEKEKASGAN
ncbi:hypothetical protein B0J18DRAFT_148415 [Chaetomium sp. MPI-SDFR-AT-0129]|nr:hypothetical protein B0J18DRAFT_148415 [Chaetomium sp. MPI-SDFR-AT-0129]